MAPYVCVVFQDILRLWRRYSVFQVKPTTEADELLMSRLAELYPHALMS